MKKITVIFLIAAVFLFMLSSCSTEEDRIINSVGECISSELYYDEGFMDYIDFGIYKYDSVDVENNKYLKPLTESARTTVLEYIENFEDRANDKQDEKLLNLYSFDKASLNTEKWYFYLVDQNGNGPVTIDCNYDIFLLNIETKTLYFFHNNT